ncbi:2-oxoglutarate (2OG) and Fe(II)-dependent oxygenase superfamily protein [Euphorbia peplus]|nr:2-oxoglutarate (2OG) and Fe(II)-dependent oxygenase superfamily protein [Euphorbia peplus]
MASSSCCAYFLVILGLAVSVPFPNCFAGRGWKELRDKEFNQDIVIHLKSSIQTNGLSLIPVVQLSWRPRVFLYKGFLTDEECDHIISLAQAPKETIVGKGDDLGKFSESLLNMDDDILARIEERISAWTFIPKENSKPLQVMHYGVEEANQHLHYFGNTSLISNAPLMATLVLYLSNVGEGGEIIFPDSELKGNFWSDCAKGRNILKPVKGNAILFFNTHPNAFPDKSSSHARCPVRYGEMWSATKYLLLRPDGQGDTVFESDSSDCTDEDDNCPSWAANGECQRNPVFMTGSPDYYGTCRKSCKAC